MAPSDSKQEVLKRLFDVCFLRLHVASATVNFMDYLKSFCKETGLSFNTIDYWRRGKKPSDVHLKQLLQEVATRSNDSDPFWSIWASEMLYACDIHPSSLLAREILQAFPISTDPNSTLLPVTKPFTSNLRLVFRTNIDLDWLVASHLNRILSNRHTTSVSSLIPPRFSEAALRTEMQSLHGVDAVIILVSPTTGWSEEVAKVLELVSTVSRERRVPVRLFPIRIAHQRPFTPPLDIYLRQCKWALWQNHADTLLVANNIIEALNGGELPRSEHDLEVLSTPTVKTIAPRPQAEFEPDGPYVLRANDVKLVEYLRRPGASTIIIRGPAQSGKTRMLTRLFRLHHQKVGPAVIIHPDRTFAVGDTEHATRFFQRFCTAITQEAGIKHQVSEDWEKRTNLRACMQYFELHLLPQLPMRITLVIEKAERYFEKSIQDDFFSMLRDCHTYRFDPLLPQRVKLFNRMNLILITSTGPERFVRDVQRSPFNVGDTIRVDDFNVSEIQELNLLYGKPLTSQDEGRITELLNGHPYLTNYAINHIAQGNYDTTSLKMPNAISDTGLFGDHLRSLFGFFFQYPELIESMQRIIKTKWHPDNTSLDRLIGQGFVKRTEDGVVMRCQLYRYYFEQFVRR